MRLKEALEREAPELAELLRRFDYIAAAKVTSVRKYLDVDEGEVVEDAFIAHFGELSDVIMAAVLDEEDYAQLEGMLIAAERGTILLGPPQGDDAPYIFAFTGLAGRGAIVGTTSYCVVRPKAGSRVVFAAVACREGDEDEALDMVFSTLKCGFAPMKAGDVRAVALAVKVHERVAGQPQGLSWM